MKTKSGWKCPVCGRVWSPKTSGCEHCNANIGGAAELISEICAGKTHGEFPLFYGTAKDIEFPIKKLDGLFPGLEDLVVNNEVATYEIANFPHEEKLSSYQLRKTYEALRKAYGEAMLLNEGHKSMENEK